MKEKLLSLFPYIFKIKNIKVDKLHIDIIKSTAGAANDIFPEDRPDILS